MKKILKRIAQHLAATTGRQSKFFRGHASLVILTYHRILPQNDSRYTMEQPGMIVEPETFHMHLQELKKLFTPISLIEWIDKAKQKQPLPPKAVAVTFDDGWRDNYEHAYPYLLSESFPATIFLVSDIVGTRHTFWPEILMKTISNASTHANKAIWASPEFQWLEDLNTKTVFTDHPPSVDELDAIVRQAKQFTDEVLYEKIQAMSKLIPTTKDDTVDILDWTQVAEMRNSGLISFGSHTRNHTRIHDSLSKDVMTDEIVASKHLLEGRIGEPIRLFCYPNGDTTDNGEEFVSKHYDASLTTQSGWNNACDIDFYKLKRISIHQDIASDKTAFLSRISGWI